MDHNTQTYSGMIRSGLNLITQAIAICDHDLKFVHCNQPFQDMFQIPEALVTPGAAFRDVLVYLSENGEYGPIEDLKSFVDEKVALARKFEPHYFERTRANGTTISVEGCPLDGGGWISVYTDISEIKRQDALFRSHADDLSRELVQQSEALTHTNRELTATVRALETTKRELTESRERLDLLNRMTPGHIAHVDANGVYTQSNGRLSSVIPGRTNEIIGNTAREVLGEDIFNHFDQLFQNILAGRPTVSEFRDEESGRYVRLAMSPDMDEQHAVRGAYLLSTDVTEEVSARQALAHARRKELAAQFTSVMTHDFANLLTIIMGQQNRLETLCQNDPALKDISETIKTAARRGRDLVGSLTKIDTQRNVEAIAVNMSAFTAGLEKLVKAALPDQMTLKFSANIPDDMLLLDPGFAQDAILNLVINAAEACDGKGLIHVALGRSQNAELEFHIQDNGPGFSEDALSRGLNPFFSTKGGQVGRGLGLTSAFDFAKSSGGSLRIRNADTGGAQVIIRIPYKTAEVTKSRLVLLVDDDDSVRKTVRGYLRADGHTVIEATSVTEAQQLMTIDGLSLVVTDLDLGQAGSGTDVISLVPNAIPHLIITGLPATDPKRQQAQTVSTVLQKPFDLSALQQALNTVVSQ